MNEKASTAHKLNALRASLNKLDNLAVAFSGGVDSSLLLFVAHEVLGERVAALTARSCLFPEHELLSSKAFCENHGIQQFIVDIDVLTVSRFTENPPERCYTCKLEMFNALKAHANSHKLFTLAEGSNIDDENDYRPGIKALAELSVLSPLRDAHLSKNEIRSISKDLGLPTWNKPSRACLASRIPYGNPITLDVLERIDAAESWLLDKGLTQVRVRAHDRIARIECDEDGLEMFASRAFALRVDEALRALGFSFVTLDLQGFVSGSLNQIRDETRT